MRIALFCPSYGGVGGIETIAAALVHEFQRAGHPITVLARGDPTASTLDATVPVLRLPLHQLPRRAIHLVPELRFRRRLLRATVTLRRALAAARAEVVLTLAVSTYAPYCAALARRTPLVLSLQGGETRGQFTSRPRALRTALRRATRVVACARSLAPSARALAPEVASHLVVIPNGVDPDAFAAASGRPHPRPYAAAVGRLVRQKGFDVLLEAFTRVAARGEPIDLLIAGDGLERTSLPAIRDRLGLAERVRFLGTLDRDAVAALYRGALFSVCPSRWEGLPVACLEAMASGRAVVATAVDGIPDAVLPGETGLLVPAEDAGALATAMSALLADPALRERLGRRGEAVARERFAWPIVAGRYLEVLAEAATGR
ncbi:MAG: glycosyltransferase family 4 protein [Deltaproteobacteria bacterium]|nr:MAG: glycosyltransferase family 4 protein [Deltaproteobacteria bacterium]